jgi:hypothetical protein
VKIRLHGTEEECREVAERLAGVVEVLAISAPYPDRGDPALYAVIAQDGEHSPIPWLKVHKLAPDSNYWDDSAETYWAPVTAFAPYAVRRLRPWIFRYGWLRIPVPFLYVPLRHPAGYPGGGA